MLVKIIGGHGGVAPGFMATSYLIDGHLMIDAGSVATGLIVEEQVQVDNILISHSHLDHIKDLAFLSDNCFGLRKKPFEIYAGQTTIDAIKTHLLNDVIWPDFTVLPSADNPTLRLNAITEERPFKIDGHKITPIPVNHPGKAMGFIIEKNQTAVLFTQDTGPTNRIWEIAREYKNLKAIFTEASFPNNLSHVAKVSMHHTPQSLNEEIAKMPPAIPIFVGHLKPNFQKKVYQEIQDLQNPRITLLGSDNASYLIS